MKKRAIAFLLFKGLCCIIFGLISNELRILQCAAFFLSGVCISSAFILYKYHISKTIKSVSGKSIINISKSTTGRIKNISILDLGTGNKIEWYDTKN